MPQLLLGLILAVIIAAAAYFAHSLTGSGAAAAVLVGATVFGFGGWQWAAILLAFFISSSLLSRAFKTSKTGLEEKYSKGGRRDAGQVLANGGLAALLAALHSLLPNAGWVWPAFAAAVGAVNADTWATELGVLDRYPPRLITNLGRDVERGTSGAISRTGTLAALAGAGMIGALAGILAPLPSDGLRIGLIVSFSGLLGALFDSLLGATVQAIYYCPACARETERHPLHTCGTATTLRRGWPWLNNEGVNLACAMLAVMFIMLLALSGEIM